MHIESQAQIQTQGNFAQHLRQAVPYINAYRGKTFVLYFSGAAYQDVEQFGTLVQDIAFLKSLGIRIVCVHGMQPTALAQQRQRTPIKTSELHEILRAAGEARFTLETLLGRGIVTNSTMRTAISIISGNCLVAKPIGVQHGVDFGFSGYIRKVQTQQIEQGLDTGAVVLISPIGSASTNELFVLQGEEVAATVAEELHAEKLIFLTEEQGPFDENGELVSKFTPEQAEQVAALHSTEIGDALYYAARSSVRGVRRTHLIPRSVKDALLQELFTHEGFGTLITLDCKEGTRTANLKDVPGIMQLIAPLEADGTLLHRSREQLEEQIGRFCVMEQDGVIIACASLTVYEGTRCGELGCLAVNQSYRQGQRANLLLQAIEAQARKEGLQTLIALTTITSHWFLEHGFQPADLDVLPAARREKYNPSRNSKVMIKALYSQNTYKLDC